MSDEEMHLLNALGVTWKSRDVGTWEDRLAEVVAYKAKHGHCEIPVNYAKNPKLGRFVNAMRYKKARGELCQERIQFLEQVGFKWAVLEAKHSDSWKTRLEQLREFKAQQGHCNVPTHWSENAQLGYWVSQQRSMKKNGKLHPERERFLNEIGFDWGTDRKKEEWQSRFDQLKNYKQRFGDCSVPVKWQENPQLGTWVSRQRQFLKASNLSPEKEQLLTGLGFA